MPVGWPLVLTAGDFSVTIGGKTANVIAAYPSAETTFLVVAPPTQTSTGYYDILVELNSMDADKERQAVFYEPKAPNDQVIVLDRSGSMLADNKIGAAQNAASAFVDFLSDRDWTGVTSFASSAGTDYALHEITPGSSVRADAIAAILGLSANGTTALGQGMQQGQGLLTTAAHLDHDWTLVLLSDGWENVPPYWATVAPGITKSIVHTVALGSDADAVLLQNIAAAKNGTYFYVDVNPPPPALLAGPALSVSLAVPRTLPNRLADTYLAIGELSYGWQRLFDQAMPSNSQNFMVDVPQGLPEAVFALNWSDPKGQVEILDLLDPNGNPVKPDTVTNSKTHQQWRVRNPAGGAWRVYLRVLEQVDGMELLFTLSGSSETTLIAGVGGDPQERGTGSAVPIYGILTDSRPIPGADVYALVTGGGGSVVLQLYDDGKHGDGKPEDGLYANNLTKITVSGGYAVKLVASGQNNSKEAFTRYASTGFKRGPA